MAAKNVNGKEFENLVQENKLLLVDYWAPWCGYCRRIGPAYDKIAEQYGEQVHVVKVNIDEEPELAARERIEGIPTVVLYRAGQPLGSVVAPGSKAAIEEFIRQHRNG